MKKVQKRRFSKQWRCGALNSQLEDSYKRRSAWALDRSNGRKQKKKQPEAMCKDAERERLRNRSVQ
ncbi:hypothetical protein QG37_04815 [Candidozyma auris]|nr:hypothetical protein QG37_04815 [[Candida] auris]